MQFYTVNAKIDFDPSVSKSDVDQWKYAMENVACSVFFHGKHDIMRARVKHGVVS